MPMGEQNWYLQFPLQLYISMVQLERDMEFYRVYIKHRQTN
jgi:hypothetical protein